VRRSTGRSSNATTTVAQRTPRVIAAVDKPAPSASSIELMRGVQVSEEFMDTLPGELVDEFFKR